MAPNPPITRNTRVTSFLLERNWTRLACWLTRQLPPLEASPTTRGLWAGPMYRIRTAGWGSPRHQFLVCTMIPEQSQLNFTDISVLKTFAAPTFMRIATFWLHRQRVSKEVYADEQTDELDASCTERLHTARRVSPLAEASSLLRVWMDQREPSMVNHRASKTRIPNVNALTMTKCVAAS